MYVIAQTITNGDLVLHRHIASLNTRNYILKDGIYGFYKVFYSCTKNNIK